MRSALRRVLALRRARGEARIERSVEIARGAVIEVAEGARLQIGAGAVLGAGARVLVRGGHATIADGAVLEDRAAVVCVAEVAVGRGARIGAWAVVMDFTAPQDPAGVPLREAGLASAPVAIGEAAVIGAKAVVGPGARVPAGGRVLAGSTIGG